MAASSHNAISLFNSLRQMQATAGEFNTSIDVQANAAKILMGDNPQRAFEEAHPDRQQKLTSHLETLTKMALGILGPKEVEFYATEFNRRAEHFEEETLSSLRSEVQRIKEQALSVFSNQKDLSFEEVWKTYHQSIPHIMRAANLVSRQIALSNIAVSAGHKVEARGSSQADADALIDRAKAALKLDDPKSLIPTDEIAQIERQFLEETGRL